MNKKREELIDRMIHIYGFEHPLVIRFVERCERCPEDLLSDTMLEISVLQCEHDPLGNHY